MGSRISLNTYGQLLLPKKGFIKVRPGWNLVDSIAVSEVAVSPVEAFKWAIKRYQVTSYRGVELWEQDDKERGFFSGYRHRGLSIAGTEGASGSLDDIPLGKISGAVRSITRQGREHLRAEAKIILGEVLPDDEYMTKCRGGDLDNFNLAEDELIEAFGDLGLI